MSEVESLLPNSSTAFERALEATLATATQLEALPVRQIRRQPVKEVVPYLLWEYGLGEIAPFFKDPQVLIEQGLLWQQERGTPSAIIRALDWLNQTAQIEQEDGQHWYEVQLGLEAVPRFEQVNAIIQLVKMSLPVRSQLTRLHAGWDVRRMILSERSLDHSLLSDWSGVEQGGVRLSFGEVQNSAVSTQVKTLTTWQGTYATTAKRHDLATLDFSQFGETALINHKVLSGAIQGFGFKPSQTYAGLGFLGFSQDEMVLSESGLSESWITPRYYQPAPQVSLDEMRLNEPVTGRWRVLDRMIDQKQSASTQPMTPKTHSRQSSDMTMGFKEGMDWALDVPRPLKSTCVQHQTQGIEGVYQGRAWQNRWMGDAHQPWQIGWHQLELEGYGAVHQTPQVLPNRCDTHVALLSHDTELQGVNDTLQGIATQRQSRPWQCGWQASWKDNTIIGETHVSTHTIG